MATVIDSLLIELGLDTSKFDASQKKSVDELRKFDEQAQKTAKNTQQGSKNIGDGFEKARNALVSLGVAFVGVKAFTNFAKDMTTANAALGRNAQLFNMSARELDAWGGVLKTVGGNAESFQGSLQALQQGVASIKLGDAAILTPLARLGALSSVDIEKGTVDILKLAEALKKFKAENGEQLTFTLAQQLGLNKETYMVLSQGADTVNRLYQEQYKLSGINEKNTQQAAKLQEEWGKVSQAFSKAANSVMDELYPALTFVSKGLVSFFDTFAERNKETDGFLGKLTVLTGGLLSLKTALMGLKAIGVSAFEGLFAVLSKLSAFGLLATHSEGLNKGEDEALKKKRELEDKMMGKSGGSSSLPRNLRNNNPGNIEYGDFAKKMGAIGSDGRFAIFPSMDAGKNAMATLLMQYAKSGNNTISGIVSKWSPASENGMASTSSYINDVAKRTGLDPNKPLSMSELTAVQQAMSNHEGMIGARATAPNSGGASGTSVQTNINTINVQTQATDANGIANGLNQAIQNNGLINLGIGGNR